MTKTDLRQDKLKEEVLKHWERHSSKADNKVNNSVSSHKSTLAIIFGSTALGLGSLKLLPASDIVNVAGAFIVSSGVLHTFYVNRLYAMQKKFYETVSEYAEVKYNKAENDDLGVIKDEEGFLSPKALEALVAKTFAPKGVFKTRFHIVNQTGILGALSVASVAWYLSSTEPDDVIMNNVRQDECTEISDISSQPEVMAEPPKQPYLVPQAQ